MFGMIGIVVTFAMVFGGYILAGGKLGVILHSLPFEMMMIGGAAAGGAMFSLSGSAGVFVAAAVLMLLAALLIALRVRVPSAYDVRQPKPALHL